MMSDTTINDLQPRVAVLEEIARGTKAALERIDGRLGSLEVRLDSRLGRIEANARSDFRWLLGIMLGGFGLTLTGFAALLGVVAHGFKWL